MREMDSILTVSGARECARVFLWIATVRRGGDGRRTSLHRQAATMFLRCLEPIVYTNLNPMHAKK